MINIPKLSNVTITAIALLSLSLSLALALALTLYFAPAGQTANNNKKMALEYLNKARHIMDSQIDRPALPYLEHAAKLDPANAEIQYFWGKALFRLDEKTQAIEHFKICLQLDPNCQIQECYKELGQAYVIEENPEEAILVFSRGVKAIPKADQLYCERGCTYGLIDQNQKALADLSQAVSLNPKNGHYYKERALIYKTMHQYENSLKDFTTVINLSPTSSVAYADRAIIYKKMGKADLAAKDFKQCERFGAFDRDIAKYKN